MVPFPGDLAAELRGSIAELEQQLQSSAADNARLQHELTLARERQSASAEILRAIANAGGNADASLQQVAETTASLFGASSVSLLIADGERWGRTLRVGAGSERIAAAIPLAHVAITPRFMPGAVYLENRQVHVPDCDDPAAMARWPGLAPARTAGTRTISGTPLRREGRAIGALIIHRGRLEPFTAEELALQQSFADQAVIAIENARLFNESKAKSRELSEALQQQTATADVLKVISRSAFDLQTVLTTLVRSALDLCNAPIGTFFLREGDALRLATQIGCSPELVQHFRQNPVPLDHSSGAGRAYSTGTVVHFHDVTADPDYRLSEVQRLGGYRSLLAVPLLREQEAIGVFSLSRTEPEPFSQRQIDLVTTFADQAVIAIENVRLFEQVQAKTRDLTEALQQQTATADVLKVISRSAFDLDSVMNTLTHSAAELCKAELNALYIREGDFLVARGVADADPAQADFLRRTPVQADNSTYIGRTLLAGAIRNIADVDDEREIGLLKRFSEALDFRSILFVPLMREGRGIGVFALARKRKGQFSQREVELVQTFADQAVIAIENARLFDEVQAKTLDLTEALERQTATTEVLSVISRSPSDLRPVLEAISETAARLCGSEQTMFFRFDGEVFRILASWNFPPDVHEMLERRPLRPGHPSAVGRAGASLKPVCIPDVLADPHYGLTSEQNRARYRTTLAVPLMRDGRLIGAFSLNRSEPNSFTEKHIELVAMFADQAVIAIENTRLFDEVQAKTRELSEALTYQTGSANILRVIASSPTDVEPTLKAIVESACELCGAYDAGVLLKDGEFLRFSAHHGSIPIGLERWPINRRWAAGRAFIDQTPVHIEDISDESHSDLSDGRGLAIRMGHRSILSVPLLHESASIGAIVLRRKEVHPFTEKQITLLQTFADQAVIAIGNVRLFEEVQDRTRELAASLDELRTAQDRLVQTEKLASLGQLTAGIAHEIKNPLNFINNFAALSAELTDELNELLGSTALAERVRDEVDELTGLLKDNLQKVVQHGKRADSIVKNMLLHSRDGSGEHRPTDVNALVEDSLNLAFHGVRAEQPQFNITLKRELDPAAGMVEAFPQEITRVLLNLISNGFYAVAKRGSENDPGFEPVLSASTRDHGGHVEIRIRDNGTGIPPEVKEKMFNPFFTTKPAGEGTGLGLSMSHDIIVKQHGGTIDVETIPGEFTEFTIRLPRKSNFSDRTRG